MFGSLIRRKPEHSLGTGRRRPSVRRPFRSARRCRGPPNRRDGDRILPTLCIVKLTGEGRRAADARAQRLGRWNDGEVGRPVTVGDIVEIEFSSQKIPSTVIWTRNGTAGFKFDANIDLGELLAGRKPRHGFRARPPRLDVQCKANVRVGKTYYNCDVHDISLGGMKIEPIEEYCLGKQVVVVVESLRPIKGEVRWFSDRKAGIVFDKPLTFEELAEWIGKRLELASLKASYKPA